MEACFSIQLLTRYQNKKEKHYSQIKWKDYSLNAFWEFISAAVSRIIQGYTFTWIWQNSTIKGLNGGDKVSFKIFIIHAKVSILNEKWQ